MAELENKALVRRYYEEVLNQGRLQVFDDPAEHWEAINLHAVKQD